MFKKSMKFRDCLEGEGAKKAVKKMVEQINAKGGGLNFVITVDKGGWFAVCQEFPAIVTGGSNTNPSQEEIFRSTIEAIKTAFNVPITEIKKKEELIKSPFIRIAWERKLSLV